MKRPTPQKAESSALNSLNLTAAHRNAQLLVSQTSANKYAAVIALGDFSGNVQEFRKNQEPPIALVKVARQRSGTWLLTVLQCPYCLKQHWHGGGDGAAPLLGHRVIHCKPGTPGYVLVQEGARHDR